MILHSDPFLSISFGDARTCFKREFLMSNCSQNDLWAHEELARLKKVMHLKSLVLLRQTHSFAGVTVCDERMENLLIEKPEGDFLVTQLEHTGLAIYTADCLPIIFYDTYNRAIGICHAGWPGSINKIVIKTLENMQKNYGTELDHLRIFFGPSAKACCYVVTEEFRTKLEPFYFQDEVLVERADQLFFDLPLFNKLQLEDYGVRKEAFRFGYNLCTICDDSFCSVRRDKESMQRQLTVVALK